MNCDLTVIIPCFNAAESIRRCLDSVINQSLPPLKIIVVNDGSTDTSEEIIRGLNLENLTYIKQENKGQASARNRGLEIAATKYISFLDADDYWQSTFCKTCVNYLEENPDIDIVNTAQLIYHFGKFLRVSPSVSIKMYDNLKLDDFFDFWAEHDHIMTGSVVFTKKVSDKAGYQLENLRISQDLEYWAMLSLHGKWAFIPHPLFVTDGMNTSVAIGWSEKYKKRRKLCPSVEEWQRRIINKLDKERLNSFTKIRGKVALGYANSMILAKRDREAFSIIENYGNSFPDNKLSSYLKVSVILSRFTFLPAFTILRIREWFKSNFIFTKNK